MKAIIYCRVSTVEQAQEGFSLRHQEIECRKFAIEQGYEVDSVFIEEGESAKTQTWVTLFSRKEKSVTHVSGIKCYLCVRMYNT